MRIWVESLWPSEEIAQIPCVYICVYSPSVVGFLICVVLQKGVEFISCCPPKSSGVHFMLYSGKCFWQRLLNCTYCVVTFKHFCNIVFFPFEHLNCDCFRYIEVNKKNTEFRYFLSDSPNTNYICIISLLSSALYRCVIIFLNHLNT